MQMCVATGDTVHMWRSKYSFQELMVTALVYLIPCLRGNQRLAMACLFGGKKIRKEVELLRSKSRCYKYFQELTGFPQRIMISKRNERDPRALCYSFILKRKTRHPTPSLTEV